VLSGGIFGSLSAFKYQQWKITLRLVVLLCGGFFFWRLLCFVRTGDFEEGTIFFLPLVGIQIKRKSKDTKFCAAHKNACYPHAC